MSISELPMVFVLVGLVLYVVLGGADFGAAIWDLGFGGGERGARLRELAHASMAPVWEVNHVWLIFVLTVTWTSYPAALGSIGSTLGIPLSLALVGLLIRGAAYALRSGTAGDVELRRVERASALASVLTPFALGAAVGAIATGRVPYGNAKGDPWNSWLNPTSIVLGVLSVVLSMYMAAVFLSADAQRRGEDDLVDPLRQRTLLTAMLAGGVGALGLVVLRSDARELFDRLLTGPGLPAVVVSALAGVATVALVAGRRLELARLTSGLAVAAVVAGWALAQQPRLLPGLTIEQASAPRSTQVAVIVAIIAGAVVLGPSLALLFRLVLGGRLGEHGDGSAGDDPSPLRALRDDPRRPVRVAGALGLVGFGMLTIAEARWANLVGAVALLGFVLAAIGAVLPALLPAGGEDEAEPVGG